MKKIDWRFKKFCIVGSINTAIDATSFVGLRLAGINILGANFISTSLGIATSYFLNTRYTFKTQALSRKSIIIYFAITLFGLWIVQPLVIGLIMRLEDELSMVSYLVSHISIIAAYGDVLKNLLPKVLGVVVSVAWNYAWYSRIIFK